MTEMLLAVRITADGAQLVGQLNKAQVEAQGLKGALGTADTQAGQFAVTADKAAQATTRLGTAARSTGEAMGRWSSDGMTWISGQKALADAAEVNTKQLNRQRIGFQQLGFQAQDFFVQMAGGTSAIRAFSMQMPQAIGVLQMMGMAGDEARGKFSRFISFLGGPWGIALGVAIPMVGILAEKLFSSGSAADAASKSTVDFTNALESRIVAIRDFAGALQQLEQATRGLIASQALLIDNTRALAQDSVASLGDQISSVETRLAAAERDQPGWLARHFGFQRSNAGQIASLRSQRDTLRNQHAEALRSLARAETAYETRAAREAADPSTAGRGRLDREEAELQQRRAYTVENQGRPLIGGHQELAFISEREFSAEMTRIAQEREALSRAGRKTGVSGQRKTDADARRAARAAEREAAQLTRFGDSAADAIARINDRWAEQPRLVLRARQDTEALDALIAELELRKPADFSAMVATAQAAKVAIQDGLLKPFRDMVEAGEQQRQIDLLVLQGREREAEVLSRVQRLRDQGVDVTTDQRREIERIVEGEERINALLDKREEIIGIYTAAIADLRGGLEDLFSGGSIAEFGRGLRDNAQRLQGQLTVEALFGDSLRDLERQVRQRTGIEGTVDLLDEQLGEVGSAAIGLAGDFARARGLLTGAPAAFAGAGGGVGLAPTSKDLAQAGAFGPLAAAILRETVGEEIVVTGSRPARSPGKSMTTMSAHEYFREMGRVLAAPIIQQLQLLDDTIGTRLAGKLGGVIEGGIAGYMQGGPVMGALGALAGTLTSGTAGKRANAALGGARTGLELSMFGNMLGIRNSSSGAQIGGAIGSFLPIPGGEIIGSIAGGLIGGLFKKAPKGAAIINSADGDVRLVGNNSQAKANASGAAASVQSALASIAEALGGRLDDFAVSIGTYKDRWRVDTGGTGATKGFTSSESRNEAMGLYNFGDDQAAAIAFAISDAIADGGIKGLSAAVQKALKSNKDIDKAVAEALKVQEVELLLGGLGAQLAREFKAFEQQAQERVRIARTYGFDVLAIEERNAEDRKKLIDGLLEDRVGSLQELLRDLSFGDLFEGSAADRRAVLLGEVASARGDAEAGVDGAADRLADLTRQLVETSRDAYGTAGPEYAADRADAISAAERVIAMENERIREAQAVAAGTKAAVEQGNALLNEANDQLARINATLAALGGGFGSGILANALMAMDVSRGVDLR